MATQTADLFHAAAHGNLDLVHQLLELQGDMAPQPNEVDEAGHTACFYAQMMGHAEVMSLLVAKGWEAMPPENIFIGPGGRRCYWSAHHGAPAPRRVTTGFSISAPAAGSAAPKTSRKKEKVRCRQLSRGHGRLIEFTPRDHPLFKRVSAGVRGSAATTRSTSTRAVPRPTLNCNDICLELVVFERSAWCTPREAGLEDAAAQQWEAWEQEDEWEPENEESGTASEELLAELRDACQQHWAASAELDEDSGEWVVLEDLPEGVLPEASVEAADAAAASELASVTTEGWLEVPTAAEARRHELLGRWAAPLTWEGVVAPTPPCARPAAAPAWRRERRSDVRAAEPPLEPDLAPDDWRCEYHDNLKSMSVRGRARPLCA